MKIIALPGLDGTGLLLRDFADRLRAMAEHDVEVLSYPTAMSSYADIGAWISARLPPDDFAIVAESFSGPLAINLAAGQPPHLRAVIFVATFARTPRRVPWQLLRPLRHLPQMPATLARISLPFVMGRENARGFLADYRQALREVPLRTLVDRLGAVLGVDMRDQLAKIAVPSAYLRAAEDRMMPRSASADFAPICDTMITIDTPHFLLQARPGEAARHVLEFIAALR